MPPVHHSGKSARDVHTKPSKPQKSLRPSTTEDAAEAIASRGEDADDAPAHGRLRMPSFAIDGYSLELRDGDGYLGDTVSRLAFGRILNAWREVYRVMDGRDPLGKTATQDLGKGELDAMMDTPGAAGATIHAAIEDYAAQLTRVVRRFLRQPTWRGVQRIVVGGGFQRSAVGQRAIGRAGELLAAGKTGVQLRTLRHHADEGGLIGWLHLAPTDMMARYDALLAVDIGGTNVRCGIVRTRANKAADLSKAKVLGRRKWGHAGDADVTRREDLVQGIADMLKKLMAKAKKKGITLAPFVGVACPGLICEDGSIAGGTQNLPGNWESIRFHLPRHLSERLPRIDGQPAEVHLHNDAVVQGLSEIPFMQDVTRWAVLTVGTGLGNASYTNIHPRLR